MSVPKQGGVLNYLGKQEIVKAPKHWQSSPTSPKTELVYITDAEKGLLMDANLHGSLLDKPNVGPSNLLSFDGWGDTGDFSSPNQGPAGGQSSGGNYGGRNDNWGNDQEDDVAQMEKSMNVHTDHTPTGWSGDSGADAWDREHGGGADFQGTQFTGGTYATDKTPASRTLHYGNDAATEDQGRPDITYFQPTGTIRGDSKSKYELNQIKYIQDQKLKTVKNKLQKAGFDISDDATFAETKAFINDLSADELPNSYKDLKNADGTSFYSQETIDQWEKEGYLPEGGQHNVPGFIGGFLNKADKPLTRDELWSEFDEATEVGKSGGGKMDWQERMKTYSPMQYAIMTGQDYNRRTKTFTPRDSQSNESDALSRVTAPYEVGGTPAPVESQAAKWYANLGKTSSNTLSFQAQYNAAKTKQASILGTPSPMRWLAVSQSPYYNFLKENKLDRGIL